jgi:putative spermidine/putrescine transport system substrate-binding protein
MRFRKIALCALGGLAVAAAALAQQSPVTIVTFGGFYAEVQRKTLFQPASERLRIPFREDTGGDLPQIRAQVTANAVTWDIVTPSSTDCLRAANEGLLTEMDYRIVDTTGIDPSLVHRFFVANDFYSLVLTWSSTKYGANGPTSWADFFDTRRFPGRRSLPARPNGTLEIALLADGVPMDQLYPLDVERAFRKLESLGRDLTSLWRLGGQSVQLMKDGEVDMIAMFNGRAEGAIADGVRLGYTFNQGIMTFSCWGVPRGARNAPAAMRFINEFLKPAGMAEAAKLIPYGPAQMLVYQGGMIPANVAKTLPTSPENIRLQVNQNLEYWIENGPRLQERWDRFIQSRR